MGKMSHARTIKIQKLQNKNRMVGQTFNPGGHTSASLDSRESYEIDRIKSLSNEEFIKLGDNYNAIAKYKLDNDEHSSNSFEQNVFIRNFTYLHEQAKKLNS